MAKEQPSDEDIAYWHRWFGRQNNNRGWALAEQLLLDEVQQRELLFVAYAGAITGRMSARPCMWRVPSCC